MSGVESEGVSWYLLFVLLVAFGVLGWWIHALFQLGSGPSGPNQWQRQQTATAVALDVSTPYVRPTMVSVPLVGPTATPYSVVALDLYASDVSLSADMMHQSSADVMHLVPTPVRSVVPFKAELRTYWPDDGPDWCLTWSESEDRCVSPVTDGRPWRDLVGIAAACPDVMLGGRVEVPGVGSWVCADTGVSAACFGDVCSILVLTDDVLSVPSGVFGSLWWAVN